MITILFAYLHYVGIMVLMGALLSEYFLFKRKMNPDRVKKLTRVDIVLSISIAIVLVTGLFRWFFLEKGFGFYLSNPLFHIKLTLFIIILSLSVFSTLKFRKWRKLSRKGKFTGPDDKTYKLILTIQRAQLAMMLIIPLLGVMLGKDIGL